jgi:prevent-host-death family protein
MNDWQLQDAKNRFSAVVDAALSGFPQRVTRRGKPAVVVLSVDEYARLCQLERAQAPTLTEVLLTMPQDDQGFDRLPFPIRPVLMFLIDTDVLSALRRRERHDRIVQWMSGQRDVGIHLRVVTVGEIEREIAQQKHQDPAFAQQLTVWLDQILALYSDRMLAIDLPTARRWGRLTAEVGHSSADLLIAATALEHGLTVVTCNVRHFEPTGVPMLNPIE